MKKLILGTITAAAIATAIFLWPSSGDAGHPPEADMGMTVTISSWCDTQADATTLAKFISSDNNAAIYKMFTTPATEEGGSSCVDIRITNSLTGMRIIIPSMLLIDVVDVIVGKDGYHVAIVEALDPVLGKVRYTWHTWKPPINEASQ